MFPIDEDDSTQTWCGSDKHDFVIDYFDTILTLRETFADMPETAAMAPRKHLEIEPHVPVDVFYLVDSWPVPVEIGGDNPVKYVNPNHPHRDRYSNLYVRCACGAFMRLTESSESPYDEKHTECPAYYRFDARAELARRRARAIRTLLRLYKPLKPHCRRFGYDGRFRGNLPESLNIDWGAEKDAGRQLLANTSVELLKTRTPKEIADVYGIHWKAIHRAVGEHTDWEMADLQEIRRANGRSH